MRKRNSAPMELEVDEVEFISSGRYISRDSFVPGYQERIFVESILWVLREGDRFRVCIMGKPEIKIHRKPEQTPMFICGSDGCDVMRGMEDE